MMDEKPIDPKTVHVIGGPPDRVLRSPSRLNKKRIIKSNDTPIKRTRLIGGDCPDDNGQPPSIILEREGDRITKIIVKCVCGRHAELVCEDETEDGIEDKKNEIQTDS